jgi:hypothetical protein
MPDYLVQIVYAPEAVAALVAKPPKSHRANSANAGIQKL